MCKKKRMKLRTVGLKNNIPLLQYERNFPQWKQKMVKNLKEWQKIRENRRNLKKRAVGKVNLLFKFEVAAFS